MSADEPSTPDVGVREPLIDAVDESVSAFLNDRFSGRYAVDPWGFDPGLASLAGPLARLRWHVEVDGAERLPAGPALVVYGQRMGLSERWVLMAGVGRTTGRFLRPVGGVTSPVLAPLRWRMGEVPANPADVRALLRAGELVGLPLGRSWLRRHEAGRVDAGLMAAALSVGAPVVPAAVVGHELGRRWQVVLGAPIATRRRRVEGHLSEAVRSRVSQLLEAARVRDV